MVSADKPDKIRNAWGTAVGFNKLQIAHTNTVFPEHPESSDRISEIENVLEQSKLLEECIVVTDCGQVEEEQLISSHDRDMINKVLSAENMEQDDINKQCESYDSVFMTTKTAHVAREGVACVRELTRRIMKNEARNGFAIVRPPGHHAGPKAPNGFCIFNNPSQSVEEALSNGAKRVFIVDLDVHHGQGTQQIFYDEKRVLYFSIHRYEHGQYWPHLKESNFDHIGMNDATGYNANVPLNEIGCGDSDYLTILWHVLLPLATQFDPDFVIVSAGFDSCKGDPLGEMNLTPDGYSHLIYHLKSLAQGRLLMILEGGYNHKISAVAVHRCLRTLLGYAPYSIDLLNLPKESTIQSCLSLISSLRPYWTCFHVHPTRESKQVSEWKTFIPKVIYTYNPNKKSKNTENINQQSLLEYNWRTDSGIMSKQLETLVFYNEGGDRHFSKEENHPESPKRTERILEKLRSTRLLDQCVERKIDRLATDGEILAVHTKEMLEHLKTSEMMTKKQLEAENEKLNPQNSIYLTNHTLEVSRRSAGTLIQAVDEVYEKKAGERNAFAVIRPPGHHASSSKSSGFCIFNNVAIAAKYAQKRFGASRILILDWDVHHGNGTQDIFYEDKSVVYMSIHRHDKGNFYPMGELKDFFDVGENEGVGYNVNVPFSDPSMGDFEYQTAFHKIIMPIAYQFNPDLVFISAGFDAAHNDPLGGYEVKPETFALMAYHLSSLASGRVITVLEGGYNLKSISESAQAVCEVLLHRTMIRAVSKEKESKSPKKQNKLKLGCIQTLRESSAEQAKYWKILQGFQVILGKEGNFNGKMGKAPGQKKRTAMKGYNKRDENERRRPTRNAENLDRNMGKMNITK